MKPLKRRYWFEGAAAVLALVVFFSISVPLFLRAQKAGHRRQVEQTIQQLAQIFKETPLTQTHLSRFALNFRTASVARFIEDKRISSSSTQPVEKYYQWGRYWLVLDRIVESHPEVTSPDIEEEVNYFLDVYDDSLFIVYAWMGASIGETRAVYLNSEPVFRPEINSFGYYEANCLRPRYGVESGWDGAGVVYCDSYQAGWRKQPESHKAVEKP
ncbi:hypothetical protein K8I31_19395 [bacterium]|nr:hypothetical protein [bacterium]